MSNQELFHQQVGLCIIDIQERIAGTMPEKVLKGTLRNWLNWIETARVFNLSVVVSEQQSQALGRSLPVVAESVLRLPRDQVCFFEKMSFSCSGVEHFNQWVKKSGRKQWIVAGMETHIAVYQTARALVSSGYQVFVPRDAVISRTMPNWEIGLKLMEQSGALISSTEALIFDLLKQGGTEEFAQLSRIVK